MCSQKYNLNFDFSIMKKEKSHQAKMSEYANDRANTLDFKQKITEF